MTGKLHCLNFIRLIGACHLDTCQDRPSSRAVFVNFSDKARPLTDTKRDISPSALNSSIGRASFTLRAPTDNTQKSLLCEVGGLHIQDLR